MRSLLHPVPEHLILLVEALRARLHDAAFLARHRARPQDFTRERQLTFPLLMLFILQKTVKSIQRHLQDFLNELAAGKLFEPVTDGAVSHARAKLKASAFVELNQECLLPAVYGPARPLRRWRGHRLLGVDSSLLRLPESEALGRRFGWKEASNQSGATGTRYPEARLSVLYDLFNQAGPDARLEPGTTGEAALAIEQLAHLQPGDVAINDRGFSGYIYFASVLGRESHFIGRCSSRSFLAAQEMFRLNRAGRSKRIWLFARPDQKAQCLQLGLALKIKVRLLSVRLPTGELEVLATSLLEERLYPTREFLDVYHWRWGHETCHLMLKGRMELENFSGRTLEAVQQDVQAAVLLANLETLFSEPAQAALTEKSGELLHPLQVNRSNSHHALKMKLLDLLCQDTPAQEVIRQLSLLFVGSPVPVRSNRKVPRRRPSVHRSYHFQRHLKKAVF